MHETCESCGTTFAVGLKSCPHCQAELLRSVNDPAPIDEASTGGTAEPPTDELESDLGREDEES